MAADLVWVPTVWSLGLLGVAGLAGMFLAFAWRAVSMSSAGEGDAAFLSIVLLGVIVGVFLLGCVEWTIFDPWHTPLALSFFALLVAERHRQRAVTRHAVTVVGEEAEVLEGVGHG
jgi:O-antigen ligase